MSTVPASTSLHRSATTPSPRTNNINGSIATTKGNVQVHQSYEASNGRHNGPERVQQLNRSVMRCEMFAKFLFFIFSSSLLSFIFYLLSLLLFE